MRKLLWPYSLIVVLLFGACALITLINHKQIIPESKYEISLLDPDIFAPEFKEKYKNIVLVDPETAPPEIQKQVMDGYRIIMNTQKYAKEYAGDKLNCQNCHFEGGNTLGGRNGSISLVGVAYMYPRYSERMGRKISLGERVNNCFERSMNGRPIPLESPKMQAIIAYLDWISAPVKGYKKFPWLGLPKIVTKHQLNAENGEKLYNQHCAACHLADGNGTELVIDQEVLDIPPLWGDRSFNKRAGMYKIDNIAPFVLLNMPFKEPILTEEEALDISQYIHNQHRP